MRLSQAPLNTCLDNPLFCQPLSSRFALHGLRTLDQAFQGNFRSIYREKIRDSKIIIRANFVLQTCHPKEVMKTMKMSSVQVRMFFLQGSGPYPKDPAVLKILRR